ncbi:MAG: FAD-dependent oxidoreductase [Methylobacterium sp.]|nr:FAD-dependent oxidoreductase [Methylobacterium sp.]MCA3603206.1 FAD-dependent oxidoreductase [Methylobacterium sp.]MCA3615548.1 FAD-dependent oxidoreductase [Methylobacterium sp.]MCA4911157.1 FAD-dependent oxidoreductase [Methylobacterium sp.]
MAGLVAPSLPPKRPELRGDAIHADLCIIGAGSGGLSVAAGAAQMGASVVLIEKAEMGGDCLNTGCVPSKALIAAAHMAHAHRIGGRFGIHGGEPDVRFPEVHDHVHGVIGAIAPHDSVERFEGLGVMVIEAAGHFVDRETVEAGGQRIKARRFVVATGSRAAVPPIPGLAEAGYLTNETIFDLKERPAHLIIVGGGPIGIEMAQAFRRLGSEVTVIEKFGILARDEPEAVEVVRASLQNEGVRLVEKVGVREVRRAEGMVTVTLEGESAFGPAISGSHILIAAGRRPNIENLGLDAAGIAFTAKGITVDARLITSNRKVFAIGDVAGGPQFTHIAGYHAGIVIRNALFGLPAKVDDKALPWVTFTDPELAHAGLTEAEARKAGHAVEVLNWTFALNDRAQAERATEGLAKVILGPRGRILGATIVGPRAGELIGTWGLAISAGLKIGAIASAVLPYPTLSEISKRVAGSYYTPKLFGTFTRRLVGLVQRFLP